MAPPLGDLLKRKRELDSDSVPDRQERAPPLPLRASLAEKVLLSIVALLVEDESSSTPA